MNSSTIRSRFGSFHLIVTLLSCLALLPVTSRGQTLSAPEQKVFEAVRSGEGTDLGTVADAARTVSGEFLASLLSGELPREKLRRSGIQLVRLIVKGRFDASGGEVHVPFSCELCTFNDDVDLSDVHFQHNVSLKGARFKGDIHLDHSRLDGNLDIRDAQFDGLVDFSAVQVAGSLYADGFHLNSKKEEADFDHVKVGTLADLTDLELNQRLNLVEADIVELLLGRNDDKGGGKCDKPLHAPLVDLEGATIRRDLRIGCFEIDELNAPNLEVLGRTSFEHLAVNDSVDFTEAHFNNLLLTSDVRWPEQKIAKGGKSSTSDIHLDGITFAQVNLVDTPQNGKPATETEKLYEDLIKNWPDKAKYSARVYEQLEKSFQDAGRPRLANFAYESMRDQERASGQLDWDEWIRSLLSSWFIRYGREPARAFLLSAVVILIGWGVFYRIDFVQARKPEYVGRDYSGFWFSVVLFLPLPALPGSDIWEPSDQHRVRRLYARIQVLLGWILVPIGLAAVSGLIPGK